MTDTCEQQLVRRRRELAKRYGQQEKRSTFLDISQQNDMAQVIEKAHQNDIGVNHPPEMAALLSTIAPDQQVPAALCNAVASLVVWLQHLEEQHAEDPPPPAV